MANATILYACLANGLAIFNKPGTSSEWLPPRIVLGGRAIVSVWAEPGPPIRVVVAATAPDTDEAGGQVLLSENGGRDWASKLEAPVTALLGLEGEPARLYVGLEGGGLAGSADGGNDWGVLPATGASAIYSMVSTGTGKPGEPNPFYIVAGNSDGGRVLLVGSPEEGDWRVLPADAVNALSWDRQSGDLFAATTRGVETSVDGGATWALMPGSPEECAAITVIPGPTDTNPSIVVGTPGDLFVSNDAGASWESLGLPQSGVSAIVRDPERRDRLYVATSAGHVFESGNRGQTWLPVNRDPLAPIGYLYVIRI